MQLRKAVEKQKNIKVHDVADLTDNIEHFEEVLNKDIHFLYECGPCEFQFTVSTSVVDHSYVCCPICQDTEVVDMEEEIFITRRR